MGVSRSAVSLCAAILLALLVARYYVWPLTPVHWRADVWNIGSAVALLVLSFGWALWARSRVVWAAWLAWAWHEGSTVLCSLAYIFAPWPIPEGVGQCAALVGADTGKLGVLVLVLCCVPLAAHIARKS